MTSYVPVHIACSRSPTWLLSFRNVSECSDTAGAALLKILKRGDTECLCLAEEDGSRVTGSSRLLSNFLARSLRNLHVPVVIQHESNFN